MKHLIRKEVTRMKKWMFFWVFLFYPVSVWAGEATKEPLHHVADISRATNFFTKWLAESYNNDRLLHSIAGVIAMTIMGIVLAYITEWIMGMLGYKTEKMDHTE